jgi:hypothetical protein
MMNMLRQITITCFQTFCFFGLPIGVLLTGRILEKEQVYFGLVGIALVVAGITCLERLPRSSGERDAKVTSPPAGNRGPLAIEVLILQILVILLFANLLDGGLRLRACLCLYLGYGIGALIPLFRRARSLTRGEILYLRWAWVPIIAVGVPLLVRVWRSKGLI